MMNTVRRLSLSITLLIFIPFSPVMAADNDWVEESNAITRQLLMAQAEFSPEGVASLGIETFDSEVMDLQADLYERGQQAVQDLKKMISEQAKTIEDPRVLQDLGILTKALDDQYQSAALEHKYILPYFNMAQTMYNSFRALLDPRNDPKRYPAALARLNKYTGQAPDTVAITELAKARSSERFRDPGLIGPYIGELEKDLENVARYQAGMAQVFTESGLEGWEAHLQLLNSQLDEYTDWIKENILPRARQDHRLPEEIYADNLKNFGVTVPPEQLIRAAQLGFADIQRQMQSISRMIASERGLESGDYRDVLRELSKEQIPADEVMPFYRARLSALEDIIRENDLVSLPERDAVIRLATEAESAAVPAPFLSPPQLIGNTGQPGEFVLVTSNPGDDSGEAMTDFGSAGSTWSLTAHEARPGHEMQFAFMVENGVSEARVIYAMNSANVEGWGLYSEAIMNEYLPLDGQLFGLKARLMRAARAFIDPMLNLGMIDREQALEFIINDVGLSRPMAVSEVDRYTFRAPGQATSYYFGYMNLMSMRTEVELRLRGKFNQRDYHDFLLRQGVLPPAILRQAVMEQFVAPQLDGTTAD